MFGRGGWVSRGGATVINTSVFLQTHGGEMLVMSFHGSSSLYYNFSLKRWLKEERGRCLTLTRRVVALRVRPRRSTVSGLKSSAA